MSDTREFLLSSTGKLHRKGCKKAGEAQPVSVTASEFADIGDSWNRYCWDCIGTRAHPWSDNFLCRPTWEWKEASE